MLALVSANLIIYISTLNPLISSAQCYIEYAAPTLCETADSPLALVCSGLAPSGIQIQIMAWGVQSPRVAERNISFLRVLCMHEARPGLSMSRPPAWYRDPPLPHTHIHLCGAWCFHTMRHTRPMSIACFFHSLTPPTCCHVAQAVWRKRWIINRQMCVSRFCWLSVHRCQTESFCFQSGACPQCFFVFVRGTQTFRSEVFL